MDNEPGGAMEEVAVADEQPLIAGRYRVLRRVGAGGMGVVWEGWDERLERAVAIKQLHPQPGLNPVDADIAKQRAMREARITARLHHPNAVSVFDVVEHEGQPCLIMQFVPSTPLSTLIRERGPLPPDDVARMAVQISSALAAAHRAGIVHRDIKPGNVLVADDGTARISDFGISHALGDVTLTSTGMVTGTPAFLAPEVARGGEASFASDVFSLGATLYAALEGTPPFGSSQNSMALLHRVASGDLIPPSRSGPLTPLLMKMLSPDPADRPTMTDVAGTVNAQLAGGPELPTVVGSDRGESQPPGPTAGPVASGGGVPPEHDQTKVTDRQSPPPAAPGTGGRSAPAAAAPVLAAASVPPRQPTAASGATPPRRRGRAALWVAAVVTVLLAGAVLLSQALPLQGDPSGELAGDPPASAPTRQASTPQASPSPTPTPSPKRSATPTRTPSESEPSPTKTKKPADKEDSDDGRPSAADLARAITGYYALMPDDTDEAWPRMTASYQRNTAGGRESYEQFWEEIDRVSVSDVRGTPPDQAVATVTYVYEDGRVVRERTAYGLVQVDGQLKINSSTVL